MEDDDDDDGVYSYISLMCSRQLMVVDCRK